MYELIVQIETVQRYMVSRVWRATDDLICISGSITKLSQIAGKRIRKDDPASFFERNMDYQLSDKFSRLLRIVILWKDGCEEVTGVQ